MRLRCWTITNGDKMHNILIIDDMNDMDIGSPTEFLDESLSEIFQAVMFFGDEVEIEEGVIG